MEPQTYVSLDLETTGLNPSTEAILEVGAVKFKGHEAPETWHTLIDPQRPIPNYIQALTGIRPQMVEGSPSFPSVAGDLAAFLQDAVIVGHRVSFDVGFLSAKGLALSNPTVDTWEMASILLPELPDHQLSTLASALSTANPTPHRALADALATKDVFLALLEKTAELDYVLLQRVAGLLGSFDSGWGPLLKALVTKAIPTALRPPQARPSREHPLQRKSSTLVVGEHEVEVLLSDEGPFLKAFSSFEERPQQKAMAQAVAQALSQGDQVLLEAGTGVGKSLAYLLPAALFAVRNGTPVVISTNTINLQEQLLTKDVPALRRALQAGGEETAEASRFRTALLKGRSNYLCRRRWNLLQQGRPNSSLEARFQSRLLIWLSRQASGDLGHLKLPPDEFPLWGRVSALADDCSPLTCSHLREGQCFLFAARDQAKAAHLILVNHALLLSDAAAGGQALAEYQHLVIDEAHHLEDEATNRWGVQLGEDELARFLDSLLEELPGGRRTGLLAHVNTYLRGKTTEVKQEAQQALERLQSTVVDARRLTGELFRLLPIMVARESQSERGDERRLRLTPPILASTSWAALVRASEALTRPWLDLEEGLGRLYSLLGQGEELAEEASARRQEAQALRLSLTALISQSNEDTVRWVSLEARGKDCLCSAPLHVGQLLQERLFSRKEAVVLTSATLTTEGTFEHLKERLGLQPQAEMLLGSPFDYKGSALVLVAQDLPEPGHRQYQASLEEALIELLTATEGRALVLFTSHSALRATLANIRGPLEQQGLMVLGHGVDGSRGQLLETFKRHKGAVLLGTSSFWEGVDVVGEALSVVVIARLPFQVPSDPVFAARSQTFPDGFNQYALPLSILRFRQGFGRLIRSRSDRGVMVVLDSRLHRKAYGRAFLQSLPRCTVLPSPCRDLSRAAKRWLASFQPSLRA